MPSKSSKTMTDGVPPAQPKPTTPFMSQEEYELKHCLEFQALDEMLGLVDMMEQQNSWALPVVVAITPINVQEFGDDHFYILSGERKRDHHLVAGFMYTDRFQGKLSLDGRTLTVNKGRADGTDWILEVKFPPQNTVAFRNPTYFLNPSCRPNIADQYMIPLNRIAKRVCRGDKRLYDIVVTESEAHRWVSWVELARFTKGLFRAHSKLLLIEKHRDGFRESGLPYIMKYQPLLDDLASLRREIGADVARINRASRYAS